MGSRKSKIASLHLLDIHLGIDAGTIGPFIQNSDHRNRITVLNATGQIELTGHGHDGLRPVLHDDSSRQRPSRGHSDLHLILIGELNQIFDFTLPATLAVFDISRDLDLTVKILNAVGKKDQESIWPGPVMVGSDKMVIQLDEGLLNLLFRYPYQSFPSGS